MPHIELPQAPGIVGPMMAYPLTAKPLNELAELLLVKDTPSLSRGERELLASYVSFLNSCVFCSESHGAAADVHLKTPGLARSVWGGNISAIHSTTQPSLRLATYLRIAARVQSAPVRIDPTLFAQAKHLGATDEDLHDVVLTASAFCMFNRYVDGLGTECPPRKDPSYLQIGKALAEHGYIRAIEVQQRDACSCGTGEICHVCDPSYAEYVAAKMTGELD